MKRSIYIQGFKLIAVGTSIIVVGCNDPKKRSSSYTPSSSSSLSSYPLSIYPSRGPKLGGNSISIYSSKVQSGDQVTLGGKNCLITSQTSYSISCTAPAATAQGSVDVAVTHPNGGVETLRSGYTYEISKPSITHIYPSSQNISESIVLQIYGSDFYSDSVVRLGDINCGSVVRVSSGQISCTLDPGVLRSNLDAEICLTNPDEGTTVYGERLQFTYSNPTISSVNPSPLPLNRNTTVSIIGTDFFPGVQVTIDGSVCRSPVLTDRYLIRCDAPSRSTIGSATLTVTNVDGRIQSRSIQYGSPQESPNPQPTRTLTPQSRVEVSYIISVEPHVGPSDGGTYVILSGSGFTPNSRVYLGAEEQRIVYANNRQIMFRSQATAIPGSRNVRVVNPNGQVSVYPNGFTYQMSDRPESRPTPEPRFESRPTPEPRFESRPTPEPRFESRPTPEPRFVPRPSTTQIPSGSNQDQMQRYRQAAEQRIQERNAIRIEEGHVWGAAETIMNAESTRAMRSSVNALDRRYPQAIPNTDSAFDEVFSMVNRINLGSSQEKIWMKQAAIRFLERVRTNFIEDSRESLRYPYPLSQYSRNAYTLLTVRQSIALSWYAVNDASVYTTEMEREDRRKGFVETFAIIQRAHNDHGPDSAIIMDPSIERDQPSCEPGTYKRIFEHLDNIHPDVRLNAAVPPSRAEITRDIQQSHENLFPTYWAGLTQEQQQELRQHAEDYSNNVVNLATYTTYLQQLRSAVRTASPGIPAEMLENETNVNMMLALINASIP